MVLLVEGSSTGVALLLRGGSPIGPEALRSHARVHIRPLSFVSLVLQHCCDRKGPSRVLRHAKHKRWWIKVDDGIVLFFVKNGAGLPAAVFVRGEVLHLSDRYGGYRAKGH